MNRLFNSIYRLVAGLALVLALNVVSEYYFFRIDLTAENRYSLHPETKKLLEQLPQEVFVRVYLEGDDLPPNFKKMRRAVREMLQEFDRYGRQRFAFTFLNPTENADKKVRFALYRQLHNKGLQPIEAQLETSQGKTEQKMVFPGAILSMGGRELGVNLLKTDARHRLDGPENIQNSLQALEYELTNAIRKLIVSEKPRIAFIEGHGELPEMNVVAASNALSEYYEVQRGRIGGQVGILDGFEAVVVAQPTQTFERADKYVLDQYIMQGGKVLWLVDGVQHQIDSASQRGVVAIGNDIDLMDQLFRYGARINPNLVQDLQSAPIGLARDADKGGARIQLYPWPYFPVLVSDNSHVVNKYLPPLRAEYISTVDTVGDNPLVHKTILLRSSPYTKVMGVPVHLNVEQATKPIQQSDYVGRSQPLAVLLEGTFESAFTNRPIDALQTAQHPFRAQSQHTRMVVVGTGSLVRNELSPKGEVLPLGFDPHAKKMFAGNREFLLNAVNYLTDDDGLMSIRNRQIPLRLLHKARTDQHRRLLQWANVGLPVLFFVVFGFIYQWVRHLRFGRHKLPNTLS